MFVSVNVFGRDSSKESLVVSPAFTPPADPVKLARKFTGRRCFVEWPYLREALVVAACDGERHYIPGSSRKLRPQEQAEFVKQVHGNMDLMLRFIVA